MKFNFEIEDVQYVKLLYRNSDGSPNTIKAAIKKLDEEELIVCINFDKDFIIDTPQIVTLSIICNDGLYRTKTTLKTVEKDIPYHLLILDAPSGMEYQQNREYFRVRTEYNCAYYVKIDGEIKNFTTKTYDISANGVSIILPIHAFSEESSEIDIMVDERMVHAKLQYIRSEKLDEGYKLSFAYTDISNMDRDCISQACIRKQLEEKRNSNNLS